MDLLTPCKIFTILIFYLTLLSTGNAEVPDFLLNESNSTNLVEAPPPPPSPPLELDYCKRKANKPCQPIPDNRNLSSCFGAPLPYEFTSNELVNENFAQYQLHDEMKRWQGLQNAPKCWNVIQPLLCFLYKPKCQDDFIELPPQRLCHTVKKYCGVTIKKSLKEWPSILRCEDPTKYTASSQCQNNDLRERRFNFSDNSTCIEPLQKISSELNYHEGFEGCTFNCSDPLFTKDEQDHVSSVIKWLGIVSGCANGFVVITSIINWKSAKQYPTVILVYMNCWYFIATLGWMFQFFFSGKDDIVCRKDLTIRRNEPYQNENMICTMVFVIIYFGVMSALAWLCVFAYVWNLICNAVGPGRVREQIDKKRVVFNFVAILCPLALVIICLSMDAIDASSISGVCFIGINDYLTKILFLIVPLILSFAFSMIFFWRGINRLRQIRSSPSDYITKKGRRDISSHAWRVGIISAAMLIVVVISLFFQFRLMSANQRWKNSLEQFIICKINLLGTDETECELSEKADVNMVIADFVMFFVGGILVSSWAWTKETVKIWVKFFSKLFRCDSDGSAEDKGKKGKGQGDIRNQKHHLISQAFSKRHLIHAKGRLSLSLQSMSHGDLMGMNKLMDQSRLCKPDLEENQEVGGSQQLNQDSIGSFGGTGTDVSSDWAAALPHLLERRGGLIPPHSSGGSMMSGMSEGGGSRWPSVDSVMSELSSRRKRFKEIFAGRRHGNNGRRSITGSSLSLGSSQRSQILPAIMALIKKNVLSGGNYAADDMDIVSMNEWQRQPPPQSQPSRPKTIILREQTTQTSFETLVPPPPQHAVCEVATQSSMVSLHEVGTQKGSSAIKKKDKKHHKKMVTEKGCGGDSGGEEEEDPISKLLTPI